MYKLFRVILLFFFIFDISFNFLPVSTGKIATFIFLLLFFSIKGIKYKKKQKIYVTIFNIVYGIILIYNTLLFLLNPQSDITTLSRLIYFGIYCIAMSYVIPTFFTDLNDFFQTFGYVTTIQGIFVLVSWISNSYRQFLESIVVNTGNISFLSERRPPGLMSSAGAGASVILALGSVLLLYLILNNDFKKNILNVFCFVVSFTATFIVGRTGLLLASVLIVFLIFASSLKIKKIGKIILGIPLVLCLILFLFNILESILPDQFYSKIEWVFGEFSTGLLSGNTAVALSNMTIKPISIETIVGTSRIRLEGGNHDSGYIQNYHSMGLIFVILFYLLVIFYCVNLYLDNKSKLWISQNKTLIMLLCLGMFIVEIKEPFIFYYFYPWLVFSIFKLKDKKSDIKLEVSPGLDRN